MFHTSDKSEAEKKAVALGNDYKWLPNDTFMITSELKPVTRVHKGLPTWFNPIHGMHQHLKIYPSYNHNIILGNGEALPEKNISSSWRLYTRIRQTLTAAKATSYWLITFKPCTGKELAPDLDKSLLLFSAEPRISLSGQADCWWSLYIIMTGMATIIARFIPRLWIVVIVPWALSSVYLITCILNLVT